MRDNDPSTYGGRGVLNAVFNVEAVIGPKLIDMGFTVDTDQRQIDSFLKDLDGTENKGSLGANAILGVSMACARAGAKQLVSIA